jgi:hypothetical protein
MRRESQGRKREAENPMAIKSLNFRMHCMGEVITEE